MRTLIQTRKKVTAAAIALALTLALAPSAAFAEPGSRYASNITVGGLDAGATVTAYKIVDSKVDASNNLAYEFMTGIDEGAYKALKSNSPEMKAETGRIAAGILGGTMNPLETKTETAAGDSVTFQGLDDGQWLVIVTGTDGSTKVYQNTVVDNTPKVAGVNYEANPQSVDVKSESGPTPDKKIDEDGGVTETHKHQIGDTVPFVITAAIPNYPSNYTNYTFAISDAPSDGLVDDVDSVTVQANGVDVAKDPANYKVDSAATNGFKLTFTEDFIKTHLGQNITVKYNAELTSDAFKTADGVTHNSMTLEYSNSPDSSTTTEPVEDKVHTYGFFFKKVDKDKDALEGAVFTLYDESGTKPILDEDGNELKSTSDENGYVWFEDLADNKTYMLKETTVPAGKQAHPDFTVTISKDSATLDNPATADVTEANYQKTDMADNQVVDPDQPMLPVTGGPGTIMLTAAGVILIAGGAVAVTRSRKRDNQ
ncbi:MAG: SpaH/EbpB family LPXTG-anchored major pilin [Atopobiaceae bacterium]|nr:SpaH/EbpB family LPXTG-anchored major pilin [Atopobiaceae bacterium]